MSFENKKYCYQYPRPSVTSDNVIFGFDGKSLKLLLIERGIEPYKGMWALPGGFMKMDETIDECARRELREETGVYNVYMEQFRVYSDVDRDPRGRVVTVAFIALVRPEAYQLIAGDDAARAHWFDKETLPPLAFDHRKIIDDAYAHLKMMLKVKPLAFNLLDDIFSLEELRKVYETINATTYDRRNFQRKLLQSDIVAPAESEEPASQDGFSLEKADMAPAESNCASESKSSKTGKGRPAKQFTLTQRIFSKLMRKEEDDEHSDDSSLRDQFNF